MKKIRLWLGAFFVICLLTAALSVTAHGYSNTVWLRADGSKGAPTWIQDSERPGMVHVSIKKLDGTLMAEGDYYPNDTLFIFDWTPVSTSVQLFLETTYDLNIKMTGLNFGAYASGDAVTCVPNGGNVNFILDGYNRIRDSKGPESWHVLLPIPPGKTYTISGSGTLELVGATVGNSTGTLRLEAGTTVISEYEVRSNIIFAGGHLIGPIASGVSTTDAAGNPVGRVTLDFSSDIGKALIREDNTVIINDVQHHLNEYKTTLYLPAGTTSITVAHPDSVAAIYDKIYYYSDPIFYNFPIPAVTMGGNPEVKIERSAQSLVSDLRKGPLRIDDADTPGFLNIVQNIDGVEVTERVHATAQLVWTTYGETDTKNWVQFNTYMPLYITLRDCHMSGDIQGNTIKELHLTLEGENRLDRVDVFCESDNSIVYGSGIVYFSNGQSLDWINPVTLKGATIVAVVGAYYSSTAGCAEHVYKNFRYESGSVYGLITDYWDGDTQPMLSKVKSATGNYDLYPVTLDFSDPGFANLISADNVININGTDICLDSNKKAYMFFPEGTNEVRYSSTVIEYSGTAAIPAAGPDSHPVVVLKPPSVMSVEVDLRSGSVRVEDADTEGLVRYVQVIDGEEHPSVDYDPQITRFVFTTGGESISGVTLNFGTSVPLNAALKDCDLRCNAQRFDSPLNSYGSISEVDLTLEGVNYLYGGFRRHGLHIPEGVTYTVGGSGVLYVIGGAAVGNHGDREFADAGTLVMKGASIFADTEQNLINADIVYISGSLKGTLAGGAVAKDSAGTLVYPVTLDFSDTSCNALISADNSVILNGYPTVLDDNKKAYVYLPAETSSLTLSHAEKPEMVLVVQIPAVSAGTNAAAAIKALCSYRIEVTNPAYGLVSESNTGSAVLSGEAAFGSKIEYTAAANASYVFAGWYDENGILVSGDNALSCYIYDDVVYTALFSQESVYYDEKNEAAFAALNERLAGAALIIAAYNENGRLMSTEIFKDVSMNEGLNTFKPSEEFETVSGGTVKVMLWESLESMKPVSLD
ncbi:MAG: hypothetical protein Q4C12_03365 [Clostridia bacterium]|nr:hypothetical protein [Clostridia bacterium]